MDQRDCEYKVLLSCDWGAKQTFLGLFEEEASCSRWEDFSAFVQFRPQTTLALFAPSGFLACVSL